MNCYVSISGETETSQDLNKNCFCNNQNLDSRYKVYFAGSPIFISKISLKNIQDSVRILEKLIRSNGFKETVFKTRPLPYKEITGGLLMSYDFHLDKEVPKLIEINTNAGGFFLSHLLTKEMNTCCTHAKAQDIEDLEEKVLRMFRQEFKIINSSKQLATVAIIDENPKKQFLYPEFLLCKSLLEKNGIKVFILDTNELSIRNKTAFYKNEPIDLIYNRLTDFDHTEEKNEQLRSLLYSTRTALSPSPDDYHLFAHKHNLIYLQNRELYDTILDQKEKILLKKIILKTVPVNRATEAILWKDRKKYFFKPLTGYGGKGAYNGKGLTKKVWKDITEQDYIAQERSDPNIKIKQIEGSSQSFKFDVRVYAYNGSILLMAARMYQGQTTNFRTIGGGFSPVFITEQ